MDHPHGEPQPDDMMANVMSALPMAFSVVRWWLSVS